MIFFVSCRVREARFTSRKTRSFEKNFGHDLRKKRRDQKKHISEIVCYQQDGRLQLRVWHKVGRKETMWKYRVEARNFRLQRELHWKLLHKTKRKTHVLRFHWLTNRGAVLSWSWFCWRLRFVVVRAVLLVWVFLLYHLRTGDQQDSVLIDSNLDFHFLWFSSRWRLHVVHFPFTLNVQSINSRTNN